MKQWLARNSSTDPDQAWLQGSPSQQALPRLVRCMETIGKEGAGWKQENKVRTEGGQMLPAPRQSPACLADQSALVHLTDYFSCCRPGNEPNIPRNGRRSSGGLPAPPQRKPGPSVGLPPMPAMHSCSLESSHRPLQADNRPQAAYKLKGLNRSCDSNVKITVTVMDLLTRHPPKT